jgi:hypothetical protein
MTEITGVTVRLKLDTTGVTVRLKPDTTDVRSLHGDRSLKGGATRLTS